MKLHAGFRLLISLAVLLSVSALFYALARHVAGPFNLFDPAGPALFFVAGSSAFAFSACFDMIAWRKYGPITALRHRIKALNAIIKQQYNTVREAQWQRQHFDQTIDRVMTILMGKTKFKIGDKVSKLKGSSWSGTIVGFYSTVLTPIGYAVESEDHPGSVQIYPEAALELQPVSSVGTGF